MQKAHRLVIAAGLLALPLSGRAQQEIYHNPIPPTILTQYHDVVPQQVLARQAPSDTSENRAAPSEGNQGPDSQNGACIKLFGSWQCAPEEKEVAAGLIANGPSSISLDSPTSPSVTGFVRNHWPVVIDFQPQPGTMTVLKVRLYHRRWFLPFLEVADQQVIDFNSKGGRRIAVVPMLELQETPADRESSDVRVASYSVRAYRLQDGVPMHHGWGLVSAPVEVFGIGAGPRAAGSFTLRDISFGPPQVRIPAQGQPDIIARYHYVLDRDYDLVSATLARCKQVCTEMMRPLANPPPYHGEWTGNWQINSKAKASDYGIVIRAWLNCGGASTGDQIRACEDKAAWAFGRAKPVTLIR